MRVARNGGLLVGAGGCHGLGQCDFAVRRRWGRVGVGHGALFECVIDVLRLVERESPLGPVALDVHAECPFEFALVSHREAVVELGFQPHDGVH